MIRSVRVMYVRARTYIRRRVVSRAYFNTRNYRRPYTLDNYSPSLYVSFTLRTVFFSPRTRSNRRVRAIARNPTRSARNFRVPRVSRYLNSTRTLPRNERSVAGVIRSPYNVNAVNDRNSAATRKPESLGYVQTIVKHRRRVSYSFAYATKRIITGTSSGCTTVLVSRNNRTRLLF